MTSSRSLNGLDWIIANLIIVALKKCLSKLLVLVPLFSVFTLLSMIIFIQQMYLW